MSGGLFGQRDLSGVSGVASEVNLDSLDDIRLEDVEIYNCIFEVPMQTALRRLPPSVRSSIPSLAYYTFWRCRQGALGAFELAFMGLACRTGIKPRSLTHGAFTESAVASEFFGRRYGFPVRKGRVKLRENHDRIVGSVSVDGKSILDIVSTRLTPLVGLGAFIKYSPVLNIARTPDGLGLVQTETSYEFKRVMRGNPNPVTHDAAALGDPEINPVYAVSASFALASVTLHPVRFVIDSCKPSESGGVRKIDRKAPVVA